ncbi:hypothetical protein [Lactobacillus sp.]|uniref:hypothetical protein n=1 Tax=Lactobacillus sp. TaxID=1591 RepID=UPI0019A3E403|nr:hypothetical protein [Lactobacillus sp.]MBD5430503.1 hypothetical protein [Lactobacillus sp.]
MKIIKRCSYCLLRFLKTKTAVILALLALIGVGVSSQVKASTNYNFSTVFQYYMLDNRAESVTEQGSNHKAAYVAPLGSGGISGSFSYDDIVNSAPNEQGARNTAKNFVSMMATYSTFKYFSNRVQGFESIGAYIGRFIIMIVLMPIALLMDFVNMLVPALLKLLAKMNIIPLLGSVLTNLSIQSGMLKALGLSKETINNFLDAFLAIAIIFILISLAMALRRGAQNIDQYHFNKFKGRIFTMICLPLVVGGAATLINSITDMTSKFPQVTTDDFTRYLVDDRTWAYQYNFAPMGNSTKESDIKSDDNGSFVDLDFDPYVDAGAKRIANINQNSSIAGKQSVFPNSALLMAYGMSQAFSATDYINYEGSEQSNANPIAYGSYYEYAFEFGQGTDSKLLDVNNAYYPSGGKSGVKDDQDGSYKSAINDYKAGKDGKSLNTSVITAWRDRFIYGAKNSGDLDKYYGTTPSQEMVKNQVGGHKSGTVPSDQSMFLILSTIFDENGGRYYIDAPARGIYQMKGQFDSNRSDYYVVSMIGNPGFTICGMLTKPLITLVVWMALLIAIFSVGLLDMNIRPLEAYVKGIIVGDLEYPAAFLFYALGIAGTLIMFSIMPQLLTTFITAISNMVVKAIPMASGATPTSPQQSLAYNGTPLIIQGIVGVFFAGLWIKSEKFRNILNEIYCYPWNWAKAAGARLEQSANRNGYAVKARAAETNQRMHRRFGKPLNKANDKLRGFSNKLLGKSAPVLATDNDNPENRPNNDAPTKSTHENEIPKKSTSTTSTSKRRKAKTPEEIKRNGQFDRINKDLSDVQMDPKTSSATVDKVLDAQKAVDDFRKKPTKKNFAAAKGRLEALKQQMIKDGAPKGKIAAVDKAISELDNLGKDYGIDPEKVKPEKPVKSKNVEVKDKDDSKIEAGKLGKAQQAINTFKKQPTAKNFATAKGQLEDLKKQMIKDGAPKEDIAKVDNAIKDLDNSARENGIDPNKIKPDKPVVSKNAQPKSLDIRDTGIKSVPANKLKSTQQAMDTFKKQPTAKNFATAKGQLEDLKKQMIKDGAPKEDIAKVDNAIKNLDDSARKEGIDPNKIKPDKPVVSKNTQPKKPNINPQPTKITRLRDAQQAIDTFKKQPTTDNYTAAKGKLEGLKQQMVKDGVPKEDIAKVDKAIKGLDNSAQKHGIDVTKQNSTNAGNAQTTSPTESHHKQVTQKVDQSDNNSSESPKTTTVETSEAQTTSHTNTQNKSRILKEAHKHKNILDSKNVVKDSKVINSEDAESTFKNTKKVVDHLETHNNHKPVVNVTDTKETNRIVKNITSDPEIHRTTRYVNTNQIKGVVSSLGDAAKDERVVKPLKQLYQSQNLSDVKHSIRSLQKSVRALDSNTKKQINKKSLIDSLYNLQNSNKFGGKK